jgi:hypothetical protein
MDPVTKLESKILILGGERNFAQSCGASDPFI